MKSVEDEIAWKNNFFTNNQVTIPRRSIMYFFIEIGKSLYDGVKLGTVMGVKSSFKIDTMPICGNWCGSGFPPYDKKLGKNNPNPYPEDYIDLLCNFHDLCYRQIGKDSCYCDQELALSILAGRSIWSLPENERVIVGYMQFKNCTPVIQRCKLIDTILSCHNPRGDMARTYDRSGKSGKYYPNINTEKIIKRMISNTATYWHKSNNFN